MILMMVKDAADKRGGCVQFFDGERVKRHACAFR